MSCHRRGDTLRGGETTGCSGEGNIFLVLEADDMANTSHVGPRSSTESTAAFNVILWDKRKLILYRVQLNVSVPESLAQLSKKLKHKLVYISTGQ